MRRIFICLLTLFALSTATTFAGGGSGENLDAVDRTGQVEVVSLQLALATGSPQRFPGRPTQSGAEERPSAHMAVELLQ